MNTEPEELKPLTQQEIADALGIHQSEVSRDIHRGMPRDIEGARAWRRANIVCLKGDVNSVPGLNNQIETPVIVIPEDTDPYSTVARLSYAERSIAGQIDGWTKLLDKQMEVRDNASSKKQIVEAERKLSSIHLRVDALRKEQRAATKSLMDAETKLIKMEKDRGKLISLDASKDFVTKVLANMIIWLKKLPDEAKNDEDRVKFTTIAERGQLEIRSAADAALLKI